MAQTYQVKVVTEKEWRKAVGSDPRYVNVDDRNLGFADPQKRVGYVRKVAEKPLQDYLVNHEFEHLLETEGTDEDEYGIRHKKFFKDVVRNTAAIAGAPLSGGTSLLGLNEKGKKALPKEIADAGPIVGGAIGSVLGGPVGGGLGAGAGRAFKEVLENDDPNANLGQRLLGNVPKSALGGAAAGFGLQQAGTALSRFVGQGATATLGAGGGATAAPAAAPTASGSGPAQGGVSKFLNAIKKPFQQPPTPPGATSQAAAVSPAASTPAVNAGGTTALSRFPGGNTGQLLAAAGALGLGESRQTPEVPDFSAIPSVARLSENAGQPLSDLGRLGQTRLSEQLTENYQGLPGDQEASIRRTFDKRREQVASQFKLFRPNADQATDSAFRQAMTDIDAQEADSVAQAQQADRTQFQSGRRTDIASALGVDEQTLNTLTEVAQLDVQEIAIRLGIDADEAQRFKQNFGNIAGLLAAGPLGLNSFTPQGATAGVP